MINWRAYPFLKLLLPFAIGIGLYCYFGTGHLFVLNVCTSLFCIVGIAVYYVRGNFNAISVFWLSMFTFLISFGYFYSHLRTEGTHPSHFSHFLTGDSIILEGELKEVPVKKGDRIKTILEVHNIQPNPESDTLHPSSGNLLLYLPISSISEKLGYGDVITFEGKPQRIAASTNPQAFDYRRYLHFNHIHYQLFATAEQTHISSENTGNPILKKAGQLRAYFIEILRKHLTDENQFAVGSALILGYKEEITEDVKTAYSGTGAIHVLAVSGLHVGLLYLILNTLLQVFPFSQNWWKVLRVLLLLSTIWSYALITGASPSVLRASTMFSFVILGKSLRQPTNIYNTLAISAFLLLLFDPFLLMSVGFQMSYLAVLGIVFFQPLIAKQWVIKNRVGNYFWQLVAVSIAAQFTTLPISLYYFHQFPSYFWLSGLVVVPAAFVILSAGIGIFLIEQISTALASGLGVCLDYLIYFVNGSIFILYELPFSLVRGIWITGIIVFLLYLMIGFIAATVSTKRWKWLMSATAIFALTMTLMAFDGVKDRRQRQLIIYDVYKNTLIDFVEGRNCIALQNEDIPEKSVSFAAQNSRWEMGVTKVENLFLETDGLEQIGLLRKKSGVIQFGKIRIGVVDFAIENEPTAEKIIYDYVLIRTTPKLKMEDLLAHCVFKKVIFDGSNKRWQVEKWRKECAQKNIATWYTAEDGAFILEME